MACGRRENDFMERVQAKQGLCFPPHYLPLRTFPPQQMRRREGVHSSRSVPAWNVEMPSPNQQLRNAERKHRVYYESLTSFQLKHVWEAIIDTFEKLEGKK
ncbi:unnamed protein product [Pleuronectes platessa]|uniref:Uncharacterized protein n=1 Tax=Pleuronectes platessa TaxID=8262 RepID=A0A9N7ZA81_PLEPL|nr:unnamed protein product [Pleuronectes platessa]